MERNNTSTPVPESSPSRVVFTALVTYYSNKKGHGVKRNCLAYRGYAASEFRVEIEEILEIGGSQRATVGFSLDAIRTMILSPNTSSSRIRAAPQAKAWALG